MKEISLNQYQAHAKETACYPGSGDFGGMVYAVLGLAGEAGELSNKMKKVIRDDGCVLTEVRKQDIVSELGDVLWYVAACGWELGMSLEEVAMENLKKLQIRKGKGLLHGDGDRRGE